MIRGSELQRNPVYMKRTRVDLGITLLNTESFLLIEGDKKDASPGPIIGIKDKLKGVLLFSQRV